MSHDSASLPIVIIGTGFGGIGMAIRLRQAGYNNLVLLEKSGRVGGTWRDNTYPGAACDVQSHLYSWSFEPGYPWSRKFAPQQEILAYIEQCVARHNLAPLIRFNSEVAAADFDEQRNLWRITLTRGEPLEARILITATGQLNQPAWPDLPGLNSFRGKIFHSARWDHDYDLKGRQVAVIGTGASAIQLVPEIVRKVDTLYLFQRSAAWVLPKPDRAFRQWEQTLFARLPLWQRLYRASIYWRNETRALAFTRFSRVLELYAAKARREAARHIRDPDKLRRIIPDYRIGCKRILMSNDWYPAINRPNLKLVTSPIRQVGTGTITTEDGQTCTLDAIILATGFRATDFLSPIRIRGRRGRLLNEAWQQGASAYKGITVSGFPNLFLLYGPNTNLAHSSILFMLESQFRYVLDCLRLLQKHPGAAMEVRTDRQQAYAGRVQQALSGSVWNSGCTSWYLDRNGRNTANWPGFTFSYRFATRKADPADYRFLAPAR